MTVWRIKKVMKKIIICFLVAVSFIFISCKETKQFNHEKEIIYEVLSTQYAGFEDMKQKGFSERKFKAVHNYDDLKECFDKYINDWHFSLLIGNDFQYYQKPDSDTTNKSTDPDNTFEVIENPNTLYVRCNNCTDSNPDYWKIGDSEFAYKALSYDYLVFDFRSNSGGTDSPFIPFVNVLSSCKYEGKIIITQDRWCFSGGELYGILYNMYHILGKQFNPNQFIVVGTNSGGMQLYGNCKLIEKENIKFWLPTKKFEPVLQNEKYEGEGKGYKPDIYATKENIKESIEKLGADLAGIDIK